MDMLFERIKKILGKDCGRSNQNAIKYLAYLRESVKPPCHLTGREEFPWEEPYAAGGWESSEYQKLKRSHPSFVDHFELLDLQPPGTGNDDIIATVERIEDEKIFEIELCRLECVDIEDDNYQLIDDFAAWHKSY